MRNNYKKPARISWRSIVALLFFSCGMVAFKLGVSVTERPDVVGAGLLTHAYYSLSLFVVGGVDLGTPIGSSLFARSLLWLAYFGAPILAASTLLDAVLRVFRPHQWQLKRINNHILVVGSGELSLSYLRVLRARDGKTPVVVACKAVEDNIVEELTQSFGAIVVKGDITHEFFLQQLRVDRTKKILLLEDDSLRNYEAASKILKLAPEIGNRIVIHCVNLRFMRAMSTSRVAKECQTFNTYHLAAVGLVRSHLLKHFKETRPKDVVILAGFGRFGQTILEELQAAAANELETVAIVDKDADRRVLVADEQKHFSDNYRRVILEGDIGHPDVWRRLQTEGCLDSRDTVVVLGTGREEDNLRTALWVRQKFPGTKVFARSSKESNFASEVTAEHDIINISIMQLVEEGIPADWLG
ncbi:MAG: voltage-gated potassium channel Kch [Oceanicoccus sp.]|jgi:voltage-gated potassium channel Kch